MKKWLAIAVLFFSMAQAHASSLFAFKLENHDIQDRQKLTSMSTLLSGLESKISNGIKFGVNRQIDVTFVPMGGDLDTSDCKFGAAAQTVEASTPNKILLNEKLIPLMQKGVLRLNERGCKYYDLLANLTSRALLTLPQARDVSQALTRADDEDRLFCDKTTKTGRTRRLGSKSRERCQKYRAFMQQRRDFHEFERALNRLLYNIRMDFDPTTFAEESLSRYNICDHPYQPTRPMPNGKRIKMLGMAVVYMSAGFSTSVVGHVAERYIYCLDNKLMDLLFEYTQMTDEELKNMQVVYRDEMAGASEDYLKAQVGRIYVKIKRDPGNVSLEGYGFQQLHSNRDIIEVWPKVAEMPMYEALQESLKGYKDQTERFKNRDNFLDYDLFKNNCTHPVRKRLNSFGGEYQISDAQGFTPGLILAFMKNKTADRVVIYPSQRLLRKMQMLQEGRTLFWENTTFWSRASDGGEPGGFMIFYPESHGIFRNLLVKPLYGAVNLGAAILESTYGLIRAPIDLLGRIPALDFLRSKKQREESHVMSGIKGIGMSLSEIVGLRLRYPKASPWTKKELDFIYNELPLREPKILDYLVEKVQTKPSK